MSDYQPSPKAKAIHEAGHTVVSVHLGLQVDRVTIEPNEGEDFEAVSSGPAPILYAEQGRRRLRQVVRSSIVSLYAGFPAEKRFDPTATNERSKDDENKAWNLPLLYSVLPRTCRAVGDDVYERYLHRLRREAENLVIDLWAEIEALAQALDERGTLYRDEIERIVVSRRDGV